MTPNLLSENGFRQYKNNELKIGYNVSTVFINEPGNYEDTILIDEDDAELIV